MKYLITDTRYYIIEADDPQSAVDIYEDAREDYCEDDFEIKGEQTEYMVQEMSSLN